MATYYIDGTDGTVGPSGTNISAPRKDFPTAGAAGDVYRLKRGSVLRATAPVFYWTRQGIIITDYGSPAAPKPVVICRIPEGSGNHALQFFGDTIVHNVVFQDIDRAAGETTDSTVGPNVLTFGTRNAGASGTAEGVSGVILQCDFINCTNNAINFAGITSEAHGAFASPVGILLGSSFTGLGGDGFFGAVRDYFEAGWNTFTNMGTRIDTTISGTPPGARQSGSDAINLITAFPSYAWLHDNYVDHSHWDCKHSFMLDAPAAGAGTCLALVERNVLIGYGGGPGGFRQSRNNVGINTEVRAIIRRNYIRGSRLLLSASSTCDFLDVHSNIFDVLGADGTAAAVSIGADNTSLRNNTIIGRGSANGRAVFKSSGADNFAAERNLICNFDEGFVCDNPAQARTSRNFLFNVTTPFVGVAADITDSVSPGAAPIDLKRFSPSDARLMFRATDRRVPDFWGRFAPEGISYIGAVTGAF